MNINVAILNKKNAVQQKANRERKKIVTRSNQLEKKKLPIVADSLLMQIQAIAKQIVEKKEEVIDTGLLGGKAGIVLLYAYLSKVFPNDIYSQITMDSLDELVEILANNHLHYGMSSGVAGIAFVFQHLRNIGVLDIAEDVNLAELDAFIEQGLLYDAQSGNWDPLHGVTGLGIYYLERIKETGENKQLEKIVDLLAGMRTEVKGHFIWITPAYRNYSNDNFNFGMAHGMPGVISFLSQVYQLQIRQAEIEDMISSCLSFLLPYEYVDDPVYCFPSSVDVEPKEAAAQGARLGWCYGDLGMATALIHAGIALQNDAWKNKGIEIALKTTTRTLEESACKDAPFCHGSVGLVHQYHRLYQLTKNDVFKNASEKWLHITLQHFYKPGCYVGGYYFNAFKEKETTFDFTSQFGLLDGSAGIALVYLSYLFPIKPDWDIIFLTNV